MLSGGERGIRTLEGFYTLHAFQASAIDHSAISPEKLLERRLFTRSRGFKSGNPPDQISAPESDATVAPFRAWRGSQHIVARQPGGLP